MKKTLRFLQPIAITAMAVLAIPLGALGADLDEDGLEDAIEQELIARHAPELRYEILESRWSCSVSWYLEHSELTYQDQVIMKPIDPARLLNYDLPTPVSRLIPGAIGYDSDWHINPPPNPAVLNGVNATDGLYARVTPLRGPVKYNKHDPLAVGPGQLLIQYLAFFAHNQILGNISEHEGDWCYLDVYVDREPPHALRYVVYHHHGDGNCPPTILGYDWSIWGSNSDFPLPEDGIPQCYLEYGAHEWWPSAVGKCTVEVPHSGAGVVARRRDIPNIGEAEAPMPSLEAQIIWLYRGKWGGSDDSPEGPANGGSNAPLNTTHRVRYFANHTIPTPIVVAGSRYQPYSPSPLTYLLLNGLASVMTPEPVFRVEPQTWNPPSALRFAEPLRIESWSGKP